MVYDRVKSADARMTERPNEKERYKMPKKFVGGVKRCRGVPIMYEERKDKLNLSVTPASKVTIGNAAKHQGISMSELIERLTRAELFFPPATIEKIITAAQAQGVSNLQLIERLVTEELIRLNTKSP